MFIILLGAADDDLLAALASRFEAAGHQALVADPDAHLEGEARRADALIDLWVVDRRRKLDALSRYDRWLRPDRPILACCHAAGASELAATLTRQPSRLCGFALPPPWEARKTVECSLPLQAAPELQASVEAIWKAAGLEPVWVEDSVGLVMPRVLACLANEAFFALGDGLASAEDIDRAMMLGTRYPRGPLAWAEELGLAQVLAILDALVAEHGEDRYRAAPLLRRLVAAGRKKVYPRDEAKLG